MTYSIVARDPGTGELGVAVQTCMFAVGAIVPWARAGVGAVATQSMTEPAYGWRCLDAMAKGARAADALAQAVAEDPGHAIRQVGVVDATGTADAFTGDSCIDFAGHHVGAGYAVQANMMASADVWPAMADAFERSTGSLADRMLLALHAAEGAGGDARGRMSAALVVVDATESGDPRRPDAIDLRVDDHPEPLAELNRLVRGASAFRAYFRATDALFAGRTDDALREIEAARAILPDDENMRFLHAGALVFTGDVDRGRAEMQKLVQQRPSWETVIRGFATKGLLPLPPEVDLESFLRT